MMKSYCFPSTYEFTNQELSNVANNLLDGIKIKINENDYIVGNLALREGYSPHKNINSAPTEEEYQLLLKAGLLLAASQGDFAMNLTVGFPFSTYMLYRDEVRKIIGTEQTITFDGGTFVDLSKNIGSYEHWSPVEKWWFANRVCEMMYLSLVKDDGLKPQDARTVLPLDTNTELIHTAFVSDWLHFFDLRSKGTTGKPHPDIEVLATPLMNEFKERGLI